jgi:hypothetical protein
MLYGLLIVIIQLLCSSIANDEVVKQKKRRYRFTSALDHTPRSFRRDYMSCIWWSDFINNPSINEPSSHAAKKFRRRFRVPFPVYEDLLAKASAAEPEGLGYKMRPVSAAGIPGIPLELQILAVLRVLGRATCFDGIEEITGASAESHRVFFHDFCKKFASKYYHEYVYLPRNNDELRSSMSDYSRMGIPGALGSTDCVHVRWDMCPASLTNLCSGKEGYPTLAWQATVNHKMRFLSVTKSFYGSLNDVQICKYDWLTQQLHQKLLYSDVPFHLYNSDGEVEELKGLYLICDGGFMKWRVLIAGLKFYSSIKEALWSAQMESTRKDVERAFGILKARFRCLKLQVLFHKQTDIDFMFWTCAILHNMILTFDGRDHLWEQDINWEEEGQHDLEDDEWNLEKSNIIIRRALRKLTDYGLIGRRHFIHPVEEIADPQFYQLRNKLIDHYYYKFQNRREELEWLN